MQLSSRPRRRGASLIEVVLIAGLVMLVVGLVAPSITPGESFGGDEQARASLTAVLDAQVVVLRQTGEFTSDIAALEPLAARVTLVSSPTQATSATEVSIARSGTAVGLATKTGTSCWKAKLDSAATPRVLYAVEDGAASCDGDSALTVVQPPSDPTAGTDPRRPIIL